MNKFDKLNLKGNPFRITPSTNVTEIIWAGFPELKKQIETRIKYSINIPNSSLVLNWGEYGSGKTHALRYFSTQQVLKDIAAENTIPYSIDLRFPKSKEPVKELFTQIVDKLDVARLRRDVEEKHLNIQDILMSVTDNTFMHKVFYAMFDQTHNLFTTDPEGLEFKSFLYGTEDYKKYQAKGIIRKLSTDYDYIEFISILFSILTYDKRVHSCIILWIDEFEDISLLNNANISNVNNFVRTLIDKCPNNLLMFLNLTLSAMISVADLGEFLHEAVKSRIIDRIEFPIPNTSELKTYLKELLNNPAYRITTTDNLYAPFSLEVIDAVIQKLGNASLRKYNETFSRLIEIAAYEGYDEINNANFASLINEIIIWQ
ncbi:MAG: hypothetical protein IKW35_08320 [Paludibacteraceae bacterium]|nr:hypothetical protein [Paludibacteraceae bacterium]